MNVRVDHRAQAVGEGYESRNKNVHPAGTSQQDGIPRILDSDFSERLAGIERQKAV